MTCSGITVPRSILGAPNDLPEGAGSPQEGQVKP